jgi:DHA2 family multidrug resistance protein
MGLFIWRELTVEKPVVDLSLFKDRNFICGTLIGAVFGLCLYSTLFLQPLFLQQLGYSANQTGMILIPRSLIMALAMPLAGRLYNSWGAPQHPFSRAGHHGMFLLAVCPSIIGCQRQ